MDLIRLYSSSESESEKNCRQPEKKKKRTQVLWDSDSDEILLDENDAQNVRETQSFTADMYTGYNWRMFGQQLDSVCAENRLKFLSANRGPDYTKGGKICLSKALLSAVEEGKTGFQLYSKYFEPFTLLAAGTNMSCLHRRKNMQYRVRAQMYGRCPAKDPAFFSFRNHADINRLAKMMGTEIVIYYAKSGTDFSFLEVFHDFRVLSSETFISKMNRKAFKMLSFVLTSEGELFKMPGGSLDSACSFRVFHCDPDVGVTQTTSLTESLSVLFSLPKPPPELECQTYVDLQRCSSALFHFWQLSAPILVVGYCRNFQDKIQKSRLSRRQAFSKCYYTTLAVIKSDDFIEQSEAAFIASGAISNVVCLYGDFRVGVVCSQHRQALITAFRQKIKKDVLKACDYQNLPSHDHEKKKRARTRRQWEREEKMPHVADRICQCGFCTKKDFEENMNPAGPERLLTTTWDAFDLLQLLGADSSVNHSILEQMSYLSIAAMDIEAMTVKVDLEPPEMFVNFAEIDSVALGEHTKQIQKPIMISHLDGLIYKEQMERTNDEEYIELETLTSKSDNERDMFRMMELYWKAVKRWHEKCVCEKKKLAKPLLDLVDLYRKAHVTIGTKYLVNPNDAKEIDEMLRTFAQTIPGKLAKALCVLINEYCVFTFYGQGYDHVLLESYLVPYLFETDDKTRK